MRGKKNTWIREKLVLYLLNPFFSFPPGKSKPFILSSCWRMEIGRSSTRSQIYIVPESKSFFSLIFFPRGKSDGSQSGPNIIEVPPSKPFLLSCWNSGRSDGPQYRLPTSRSRIQEPFVVSSCANSGKIGRSSMGGPNFQVPNPRAIHSLPSVPNPLNRTVMNWVPIAKIPLRDLDAVGIWRESLPITGYVPALPNGMSPVPRLFSAGAKCWRVTGDCRYPVSGTRAALATRVHLCLSRCASQHKFASLPFLSFCCCCFCCCCVAVVFFWLLFLPVFSRFWFFFFVGVGRGGGGWLGSSFAFFLLTLKCCCLGLRKRVSGFFSGPCICVCELSFSFLVVGVFGFCVFRIGGSVCSRCLRASLSCFCPLVHLSLFLALSETAVSCGSCF